MQSCTLLRNVATACAALFTMTVPAVRATAQTPPKAGVTTVLLIHGAGADGLSWSKLIRLLEAKGLHIVAVQIPLTSFADDVSATQRAIALEDGPLLLVGHSNGGAVITEAGNDLKVAALVYVSAVAPDTGESASGFITSVATPVGSELRPDKSDFLKLTPKGVAEDFAQDLSAKEIEVLTAAQVPTSVSAMKGEVTIPAWKSKPSWYIIGTNDRTFSRSRSSGEETRCDNDHCTLRSRNYAGSTVEGPSCNFRGDIKGRFEVESRKILSSHRNEWARSSRRLAASWLRQADEVAAAVAYLLAALPPTQAERFLQVDGTTAVCSLIPVHLEACSSVDV